ncbi:hypothetical protein OH76DRAFT_299273 [Lentinus brumalis]|uniref:Uncharacterized protein n=1 Tax=Lentinus brumalis TaxID=2498619 RepID=A0A371DG38_9APHY|nr:hypothetical protein OH76DRAFT_299273 [Polyporus brumalis]
MRTLHRKNRGDRLGFDSSSDSIRAPVLPFCITKHLSAVALGMILLHAIIQRSGDRACEVGLEHEEIVLGGAFAPAATFLHNLHDPLMSALRRGPWRPQHTLNDSP